MYELKTHNLNNRKLKNGISIHVKKVAAIDENKSISINTNITPADNNSPIIDMTVYFKTWLRGSEFTPNVKRLCSLYETTRDIKYAHTEAKIGATDTIIRTLTATK